MPKPKARTWESAIRPIRWKPPKLNETKDGRCDLTIRVPLTEIVRKQAHDSFADGVGQALLWFGQQKGTITAEMVEAQMVRWGLADVVEAAQKMKEKEAPRDAGDGWLGHDQA